VSRPSLDWTDATEVSIWLAGLRQSFSDADAVTRDLLRPPRQRELGPVLHADTYSKARAQILQALDFAAEPEPDADPGDPSGNGGAGPVH